MIDPNTIRDGHEPEGTPEGIKVPIAETQQLRNLLNQLGIMHEAILRDTPVTEQGLHAMMEGAENLRFVMGDTSFTAEEIRTTPELKRTLEIWKEASEHDYVRLHLLSYLDDSLAESLGKDLVSDFLHLYILGMTDTQAVMLSKFRGSKLILNSVNSLTDNQAAALAQFQGDKLSLGTLRSISQKGLQSLYPIRTKIHPPSLRERIEAAGPPPSES